jgi:hypothetical protein
LEPFFRKKDGKNCVDVLCVTHGDEDHCLGFGKFKEEMDKGNLIIGSILHQGYDRTLNHKDDDPDLPSDYLILNEEINRREKVKNPQFGDIQIALNAKDDESTVFMGLTAPSDFLVKVLSPFSFDDENSGYSHNDMSLILKIEINNKSILYTGDASAKYWLDRIYPYLLNKREFQDWSRSDVLEVGHHGSYDFFGNDREIVRDCDCEDEPDNFDALNHICPKDLIISAEGKFPLNGDCNGDNPPHYAAWKWYHKWFRDNHDITEENAHPKQFKYTSDGNICLEYDGQSWNWITNWDRNTKIMENQAKFISDKLKAGTASIGMNLPTINTRFYGHNC